MIVIIPLLIIVGILAWLLRPGKSPSIPRKVAILATVISSGVLAVAAVIFQLVHNAAGKTWVAETSNTLFIIGIGLITAGIFASAGFAIGRKSELAKGTGFGVCIAIIISVIELGLLEWLGGV